MKDYKIIDTFHIHSNIVFIVPIILAFIKGRVGLGFLFTLIFITSTLYHLLGPTEIDWWWDREGKTTVQTFLLWLDTIIANLVVIITTYIYLVSSPSKINLLSFLVLSFIAGIFFLGKWPKKYVLRHGLWHIFSAIILTFVLFSI